MMRTTKTSKRLTGAAALLLAAGAFAPHHAPAQQGKQPTQRIVEGEVLGKGDQPLANAVVFLKDTKTLFVKSYLTDDKGHFKFTQLSLSTDYDLWAEQSGAHSKTKHISTFQDKPDLDYTLKLDAGQ